MNNDKLSVLAILLMAAPGFIALFVLMMVAVHKGNWHHAVMLSAILPGVAFTIIAARWLKARNMFLFEGMEGDRKRRAQTISAFVQGLPFVFMFSFIGLRNDMTVAEAAKQVGGLFAIQFTMLVAAMFVFHHASAWWERRQ